MSGEVADGLLAHAFTTKRYADEVTTPALMADWQRAGRERNDFQVSCPVFIVTGRPTNRWRRPPRPAASRSRSTDRRPPTARCSTCTAGATARRPAHACRSKAGGTRWATSSTTTSCPRSQWWLPRRRGGGAPERCDGVIDRVLPAFPAGLSRTPSTACSTKCIRRTDVDNIRGRTIAVTGAARGIGYATARALLDRGARVVIGDRDVAVWSRPSPSCPTRA